MALYVLLTASVFRTMQGSGVLSVVDHYYQED